MGSFIKGNNCPKPTLVQAMEGVLKLEMVAYICKKLILPPVFQVFN